jgi:PAS domain S-box-containing protein
MLDPNGLVTSWNPGAQRFKGYLPSEIIGQHFSRFYTKQDRELGVPARALELARTKGKFDAEGWRVRKDGSRFWAYVVIDPIRDETGNIIGYAKVTRDLTERKETEEALRQTNEQFRLLVQGVTDYAIYLLDPEGRVSNWNIGAQRIKGYLPGEIIGSHFSQFYTEEDRATGEPNKALRAATETGRFEKEGWRVRTPHRPTRSSSPTVRETRHRRIAASMSDESQRAHGASAMFQQILAGVACRHGDARPRQNLAGSAGTGVASGLLNSCPTSPQQAPMRHFGASAQR